MLSKKILMSALILMPMCGEFAWGNEPHVFQDEHSYGTHVAVPLTSPQTPETFRVSTPKGVSKKRKRREVEDANQQRVKRKLFDFDEDQNEEQMYDEDTMDSQDSESGKYIEALLAWLTQTSQTEDV